MDAEGYQTAINSAIESAIRESAEDEESLYLYLHELFEVEDVANFFYKFAKTKWCDVLRALVSHGWDTTDVW